MNKKRVIYQQKPKQQEGNLRINNLMWTSKELRCNRLTPLNKDKLKQRTFQESEEETEPEDSLNMIFDYSDKNLEGSNKQKHETFCEEI